MPSSAVKRVASLGAALLLPILLAACSSEEAAEPAAAPAHVATAQGRLDASSETRWLSAELDARIAAVPVIEGQRVAAGTVLVELACAGREAAAADLADSIDQQRRTEALLAGGWVSQRRHEQASSNRDAACARRDAAAAALAAIEHGARPQEIAMADAAASAARAEARQSAAEADRCRIRAPIAGTVLRILRHAGEFSSAGSGRLLVAIADLSRLMVRAEVLDRDAATIRTGMRADVWLDEAPGRWSGRVVDGALLVGRRPAVALIRPIALIAMCAKCGCCSMGRHRQRSSACASMSVFAR